MNNQANFPFPPLNFNPQGFSNQQCPNGDSNTLTVIQSSLENLMMRVRDQEELNRSLPEKVKKLEKDNEMQQERIWHLEKQLMRVLWTEGDRKSRKSGGRNSENEEEEMDEGTNRKRRRSRPDSETLNNYRHSKKAKGSKDNEVAVSEVAQPQTAPVVLPSIRQPSKVQLSTCNVNMGLKKPKMEVDDEVEIIEHQTKITPINRKDKQSKALLSVPEAKLADFKAASPVTSSDGSLTSLTLSSPDVTPPKSKNSKNRGDSTDQEMMKMVQALLGQHKGISDCATVGDWNALHAAFGRCESGRMSSERCQLFMPKIVCKTCTKIRSMVNTDSLLNHVLGKSHEKSHTPRDVVKFWIEKCTEYT